MKITKKDNYIVLEDAKNNIQGFAEYLDVNRATLKDDNLVINLLSYTNLELPDLLQFLEISNTHRSSKKSFVIVNDAINIDVVPDELIVVPTLLEAQDIVNMEELERELGF
ncbi:ribonuclease Z [Gillisia sp. M10.2A]|uniref:Ribonuclease Z n=1 Tax=Gillisia lutea TaxID=2909668 RepID=A0ABS9EJ49_9FLAO|nr:ribonuclease Z [Gillisia lutea]MCF4102823.1 ribonuclease Z [Gillisia lutea]